MSHGADAWLGGRLRLLQPPRGAHRAGTDAVLLAALTRPGPGATVCDLGAGTGAVGLAVAALHPGCRVVLVERDPDLAGLARANADLNGLADRVRVVEADILAGAGARRAAGLVPGLADLVLTNPPFLDEARHRPSPDAAKRAAHSYGAGDLDLWMRTCADILVGKGRLGLIHRADALRDCLDALGNRFGAVTVRPVHPRPNEPASRVLITAAKGSRAPLALLAPLVLHERDGGFTRQAEALHRGEGWLTADDAAMQAQGDAGRRTAERDALATENHRLADGFAAAVADGTAREAALVADLAAPHAALTEALAAAQARAGAAPDGAAEPVGASARGDASVGDASPSGEVSPSGEAGAA